jgi:hypothetical protein
MYSTIQQLVKLAPLLIGMMLLVGMLIFFNSDNAAIHNELEALYLLPRPERLTELYFDANEKLPKSVTENQPVRFAFTIHNLETSDYQYTYEVLVKAQGTSHVVDSGNILVKNSQYYSKTEQFSLKGASKEQEVVVALTNKKQSIDFWLGGNQ